MTHPPGGKMSVEHGPSKTALGAATLRALAAIETRAEIGGGDYLAEIFLPEERKTTLKDAAIRESVIRNRIAPGMYEFMIARTAFFDSIVKQSLNEDIPQIVFLGAGYDSRPYRFRNMIKNTRIFELDISTTQQHKVELLRQAGISVPEQVTFVPINFSTDHIDVVLKRADYDSRKETLFVWEGVTYYLSAQVIDDTLNIVRSNSPAGSLICFDYHAYSPERSKDEGLKRLRDMMRTHYPGEPTLFGIRRGETEPFLSSRGYHIIEHLNSTEMEMKYLILRDGSLAGKVPVSLCLVLASVADDTA